MKKYNKSFVYQLSIDVVVRALLTVFLNGFNYRMDFDNLVDSIMEGEDYPISSNDNEPVEHINAAYYCNLVSAIIDPIQDNAEALSNLFNNINGWERTNTPTKLQISSNTVSSAVAPCSKPVHDKSFPEDFNTFLRECEIDISSLIDYTFDNCKYRRILSETVKNQLGYEPYEKMLYLAVDSSHLQGVVIYTPVGNDVNDFVVETVDLQNTQTMFTKRSDYMEYLKELYTLGKERMNH